MLKLFYITNEPDIAVIAQNAGVDRIFVDMEYIGKEKRQPGLDTVKNRHTVDDVRRLRPVLDKAELLVRVNPIHPGSAQEIDDTVKVGADVVMLPMWKTPDEVRQFITLVNGRAKTLLLLETEEARQCLDEVLTIDGIDEIHIGLNDLHLAEDKRNMFELLVDGVADEIVAKIKAAGIPYGIGGVGAVGVNLKVPAELVLSEHYRLGSSMAILARAFCDTKKIGDRDKINEIFINGIKSNREYEAFLQKQDQQFFAEAHEKLRTMLNK